MKKKLHFFKANGKLSLNENNLEKTMISFKACIQINMLSK